jgi:ketosteroid isomerase-like protein
MDAADAEPFDGLGSSTQHPHAEMEVEMRMRSVALLMIGVFTGVFSACAPPKAQNSPEIAAVDKAWEEAFNGGDAAKLASFYLDDARLLPPNAPMAQGRAAIEKAFQDMFGAGGIKGTLNGLETIASGDVGYSVGTYEMTDAQGAVLDRGKYIGVLRKVGNDWKFSNDTWNSDMPAAAGDSEKMIVVFKTKDDNRWKAAWTENKRAELFAQHGAPSVTHFSGPGPGQHALLVTVADKNAFSTWATSPEGSASKAEDGVLDEGFMILSPNP